MLLPILCFPHSSNIMTHIKGFCCFNLIQTHLSYMCRSVAIVNEKKYSKLEEDTYQVKATRLDNCTASQTGWRQTDWNWLSGSQTDVPYHCIWHCSQQRPAMSTKQGLQLWKRIQVLRGIATRVQIDAVISKCFTETLVSPATQYSVADVQVWTVSRVKAPVRTCRRGSFPRRVLRGTSRRIWSQDALISVAEDKIFFVLRLLISLLFGKIISRCGRVLHSQKTQNQVSSEAKCKNKAMIMLIMRVGGHNQHTAQVYTGKRKWRTKEKKNVDTSMGLFKSGQKLSGIGQCPTEYPFCADLGT